MALLLVLCLASVWRVDVCPAPNEGTGLLSLVLRAGVEEDESCGAAVHAMTMSRLLAFPWLAGAGILAGWTEAMSWLLHKDTGQGVVVC